MDSLNVVFTGQDAVEVRAEPVGELAPKQILVETHRSLISTGTEGIVLGRRFEPGTHWDGWVKYPFHPGYSQVGRVVATGTAVTAFTVGDRVASRAGHQQFAAVDEGLAYPVPAAVGDDDAAWVAFASIVQWGVRKARLELGEAVVIIGLGMLGQLALQFARASGAGTIIAIDTAPMRLAMAAAHGATHTLEMSVDQARAAVEEITGGVMADVVFDVTGHPAVFASALKLPRRFGRVILLGDAGTPTQQHLTHDVITRDLQIFGAHDVNPPAETGDHSRWSRAKMVEVFFALVEQNRMRAADLITHRYAPADAPQAYEMLANRRAEAMGVVLEFAASGGVA